MSKLLLNAEGKVLTSNDKVLKAPEVDTSIEDGLVEGTLTTYSNDRVTSVREYAFYGISNLVSVDLPNIEMATSNMFGYCKKLANVNLPNVTMIDNNCFNQCYALIDITLPKVTKIKSGAFNAASRLVNCITPRLINVAGNGFGYCYSLKKVCIEQTEKICTLDSISVFTQCHHILGTVHATYNPNGDKDGYIQVPASRLAEYKIATNWVTYASQIIGHQDFNVGDTLPNYTNETFTTQTWYSDETLTTVVTSVATAGKYYCRLEA